MRGGTGSHLPLGAWPGVPEGSPSPPVPAAIFPLPGGRGVAGARWVTIASGLAPLPDEAHLPVSTAARRRQFARRAPAVRRTGSAQRVRGDIPLGPAGVPPAAAPSPAVPSEPTEPV